MAWISSCASTQTQSETAPWRLSLDAFLAGTVNYSILSWTGHIRIVLECLTEHAERLVHQRASHAILREQIRLHDRQKSQSAIVLFNFYLLAASSLSGEQATVTYVLEASLPQEPDFPDEEGKDLLLAGVLASAETAWRSHVTTLLCTSVIEGNALAACEQLRRWALIILRQEHQDRAALRQAYKQFVVAVFEQARQWESDMQANGVRFTVKPAESLKRLIKKHWKDLSEKQEEIKKLIPERRLSLFAVDVFPDLA